LKIILINIFIFSSLLFASISGTVIDNKTNMPIKNAYISDSIHGIRADKNGNFYLKSKEKVFHIKAYGYKPFKIKCNKKGMKYFLTPIEVKALYLTFWGASNSSKRLKKLLKVIKNTQINAIVVDIKNEYGSTMFYTSFKQANSYGAKDKRTNKNIKKFMKLMKDNNIYTIARIVTFKDEIQASYNKEYAIKKKNGEIWRNHDNMAWVDPFDIRSHKYTIRIAEEAAKVGFDEINFDYIRFPARDGLVYSKKNTQNNRVKAIEDFLILAQKKLMKYGVFISVDTYGNICWSKDDNGIGQTISSFKNHTDYIAPMLYPSGFASGSFHFQYPSQYPYDVVYRSLKNITDKVDINRIRPWLQYFRDYKSKKIKYTKKEIQQQIKAAEDIGSNGWMMWSPSSRYSIKYLTK